MELRQDDAREEGDAPTGSALRAVMACFPTGVTVVATLDPRGAPVGLTVNSFTSVSLDPPLVLVCIDRGAQSLEPVLAAGTFAVSILAATQAHVAKRFAARPSQGRFEGVDWTAAPSGNPVVSGAAAWLDCAVHEVITAGDHSIVLGRAQAAGTNNVSALLFHRGALRPVG